MIDKFLNILKHLLHFDTPDVAIKEITRPIKKPSPRKKKKAVLELRLDRVYYTRESTIGELAVDGQFECYTLEDEDKLGQGKEKHYGETAIPRGTYDIDITYSPRFKTRLPVLRNVPKFKGIRIHPGNTAKHTEGCILVGQTKGDDFIGRSRLAFKALFKRLEQAKREGKRIIIRVDK